jgi:hypothetical protein
MFLKYVKYLAVEALIMGGLFSLLTPVSNVQAFHSSISDTFQVHGFATQGFIWTSENRFFGKSESGSFGLTELGINGSFRPTPDLQFSVQALSRRAGEGENGSIRLDYGMIDYSVISNETTSLGVRIGRIKNPLGLYNDTRDVAFIRPSILLPQSIYFDRTRNLALSSDGIGLYSENRMGKSNLFYQLEVAYPNVDDEETKIAFLGPQLLAGALEEKSSYISRLLFEREGGRIRLAISGAIVNIQFNPVAANTASGRIRFSPLIFSAQYNTEFWSITSEYALRNTKFNNVGVISNLNITGESYYLQGAYQIARDLQALIRYDVLFKNRDDRNGLNVPIAHQQFAKDWTLGLRWNMTDSLMSRVEYHYIDGTAWLAPLDNPNPSLTKQRWDLFALLLSYRF